MSTVYSITISLSTHFEDLYIPKMGYSTSNPCHGRLFLYCHLIKSSNLQSINEDCSNRDGASSRRSFTTRLIFTGLFEP